MKVSHLLDDDDDLKMFAPLGCGIQTGAGTITEVAHAKPSDKVAVIGLGAVGQAAVMVCYTHYRLELYQLLIGTQGAKIKGCRTIVAIDRITSRLELAKGFGATHVIDTSHLTEGLVKEIKNITGGTGTTITVDATGVVSLIQEGVEFTANQGKFILLGVPPMDAGLEISLMRYMFVRTISPPTLFFADNRLDRKVDSWVDGRQRVPGGGG